MQKALQIIADVLETDVSKISRDDPITDWDSLAFITIISIIDGEFDLNLSIETVMEQAATARTVGELLDVLKADA